MPALILIVPLIAAYLDQREPPKHHTIAPPPIIRSIDLPYHTETITFVSW